MSDTRRRAATLAPSTADPESRTVRATISTGAAVELRDLQGPYLETLDLAGADTAGLVGVPVLDAHRRQSVADVVGIVTAAGRDQSGLWADLKISGRAEPVWQDILAGILRGVSVGYRVAEWRSGRLADGTRSRTAVAWSIVEVSLVPVPADAGATVRGFDMNGETTAAPADQAREGFQVCTDCQAPEECQAAGACALGERKAVRGGGATRTRAETNATIRSIARVAGLGQAWIDRQVDSEASADQARAAAWAELETRGGGPIRVDTSGTVDHTDPAAIRTRMAGAVAARWCPKVKMDPASREFADHSLTDMAAELAGLRGHRLNPRNRAAVVDAILTRAGAHSTSDFPLLLEGAANKMMLPSYQAAAPTYRRWAAQKAFTDFKAHKFLRAGDFPRLTEVTAEGGGVTYGTMSENREQAVAKEYNSGIRVGRRVLINDDLRQFAEFSTMAGIRAASDENAILYSLLGQNSGGGPALDTDSKAVFHADHANKAGAGADLDETSYGAAVAALRKQTSLDGILLNLAPAILLVGPDRELKARRLLTAITPTQAANVNPWAGTAELVIDANIAGTRWYVFADPALYPIFIYGYVAGAAGPVMRSEIDFDTHALKVVMALDFGADAIDWRGGYFNAGA